MRHRAYRPEISGCLESRSLLSGFAAAGLPAHPIVLTRAEFNSVPEQIQSAFRDFRQGFGISQLHEGIFDDIVNIPYARVDGLAKSVNGILFTLQHDMKAGNRNAITTAHTEILAVTRADVQARVDAGDIIIH